MNLPGYTRFVASAACTRLLGNVVPNLPVAATAIVASVSFYHTDTSTTVMHTFGRNGTHNCSFADNGVYTSNAAFNDVQLTFEVRYHIVG